MRYLVSRFKPTLEKSKKKRMNNKLKAITLIL